MFYFVQIVDGWDCEVDFFGPFKSEDAANSAAFGRWNGADGYRVVIVKRFPASSCGA